MRQNNTILVVTVSFLLLLSTPALCIPRYGLTRVVVINDLGGGQELRLHCGSKDYDLGIRMLKPHQGFRWRFRPSFFGNTLFYCSVEWGAAAAGEVHWFDVYDQVRDEDRCTICRWLIKETGPCFSDEEGESGDSTCQSWNEIGR
ncbi:unnamed protein product [Linum trigynum]